MDDFEQQLNAALDSETQKKADAEERQRQAQSARRELERKFDAAFIEHLRPAFESAVRVTAQRGWEVQHSLWGSPNTRGELSALPPTQEGYVPYKSTLTIYLKHDEPVVEVTEKIGLGNRDSRHPTARFGLDGITKERMEQLVVSFLRKVAANKER